MGYWEQIGEANIRHRERRARMNPCERAFRDIAGQTLLWTACVGLWALMLVPVVLPALRGFF